MVYKLYSGSLRYNLCFTIYISLPDNPKYTLREVIVYHYRFLSSKAYQNRYQVVRIGPEVPGSISWVVDLEVLGPGSWVLILDYADSKNPEFQKIYFPITFIFKKHVIIVKIYIVKSNITNLGSPVPILEFKGSIRSKRASYLGNTN